MTCTISDMFSMIKNALVRKMENVDIPSSKLRVQIAKLLQEEGFIEKHEVLTRGKKQILRIRLKYALDRFGRPKHGVIRELKRVSKPGSRYYVGAKEIPRVKSGFGMALISTSKGIKSDQEARSLKIGGEVLGFVY